MPIIYSIDEVQRRLTVVATGSISYSEIITHLEREREDDALPFRELIDATQATLALSSQEIRQVVNKLRTLGHQYALGPTAIVVTNDFGYGMMRMLGILVEEDCDICPFRNSGEAEKWVNSVAIRCPPTRE